MSDPEFSLQQQALFVPPIDESFDPNKPPESGEEYLQRVLYERKVLVPEVVSNHINKPAAKSSTKWDNLTKSTSEDQACYSLLPTKEWTEIQIKEFQILQEKITKLKEDNLALRKSKLPDDEDDWKEFCRTNQPLLRTLISITQPQLETFLELEVSWLKENGVKLDCDDHWLGQWIYASLVCLMEPLEPNVHHLIREIARLCVRRRNELTCSAEVLPLNVLICIVTVHFKQSDLCH